MREGFARSDEGFMENWGAKVTQMAGVTLEPLKAVPVTITDPTRGPGSPQARPGAAQSVGNTHEEQAVSSRKRLVSTSWAPRYTISYVLPVVESPFDAANLTYLPSVS